MFDVGRGRYPAPLLAGEDNAATRAAWEADLARVREDATARDAKALAAARESDRAHTDVQGWLRDLGRALGYDVWIAANDRNRPYAGTGAMGRLGDNCLTRLPPALDGAPGADAVRLIDVLWLDPGGGRVAGASEVEHTTSIYSGMVRLLDLALGVPEQVTSGLFLVAPDARGRRPRAATAPGVQPGGGPTPAAPPVQRDRAAPRRDGAIRVGDEVRRGRRARSGLTTAADGGHGALESETRCTSAYAPARDPTGRVRQCYRWALLSHARV